MFSAFIIFAATTCASSLWLRQYWRRLR